MPELPEVETTLRGITPHIINHKITRVIVRHHRLRWPIPANLEKNIKNHTIKNTSRKAKYLLLSIGKGTLIIHLGMSGSLRILSHPTPPQKHDHLDIEFSNHKILRFTDPRRFGAVLWTEDDPTMHPLLKHTGPEPLADAFSGKYLWEYAQGKKVAVKSFIMNNKTVVGVGNIYATESLFAAGIHPERAANTITEKEYQALANAIKKILRLAIKQGGTTLKDFVNSDGKPGYFSMKLKVYGRDGLPCVNCGTELKTMKIGQRSTVVCVYCQK